MPVTFSASATTDVIWSTWTDSTSVSATITWDAWNTTYTNGNTSYTLPAVSDEQRERMAVEAAERRREADDAKERARALLVECLTASQRREFNKDGWFHVETANGRRRYRLAPGSAPLRVHGEDGSRWSYCIHPDYGYPAEDTVLAQKLLLETDEDAFLRIANASRVAA